MGLAIAHAGGWSLENHLVFICHILTFLIILSSLDMGGINTSCINSSKLLRSSGYDLRLWRGRSCVRIPRIIFFLFLNQKYFTILFKFLDFLRSLDRFRVLIKVIISEFYTRWFPSLNNCFPIWKCVQPTPTCNTQFAAAKQILATKTRCEN